MNPRTALLSGAMMLTCLVGYGSAAPGAADRILAQASSDSRYRVGGTLAPAKPRAPSGDYEDILWDALLPEGWSVEKVMESLNLNELGDNDPKAKEAMNKIRDMWDNAPANSKLDNRRVRIPGFVVPLDGQREKAREFLLVPYFGACIHAPAPPANQVIHVVVSKSVGTIKLSPAAWISGTIRTVRSNTAMGVSGYEMTIDKVEPYKLDSSPFPI